jgi:hypothetical protein
VFGHPGIDASPVEVQARLLARYLCGDDQYPNR